MLSKSLRSRNPTEEWLRRTQCTWVTYFNLLLFVNNLPTQALLLMFLMFINKLNFTLLLWWRSFLFKWGTEVTGHPISVSVCHQGHAAEHPSALTLLWVFLSSIWVCMYGKDRSLVLSWCWDVARGSSKWEHVVQLSSVMGHSLNLAWAAKTG